MRLTSGLLTCALVVGSTMTAAPTRAAADGSWPAQVDAQFNVSLAGFDIGTFKWQSTVAGDSYSLSGLGQLSAAFGAWTWHGTTHSAGHIEGSSGQPKPAAYTFEYRSSISGSLKMAFTDGSVSNVVAIPDKPPVPGTIPVQDHQLKNVLDPLTAVMAMSRAPVGNPCGRRISIFDGKQRFDLALSFRRQERVVEARPSGQPAIAFVCRVQYIPISGYKNTSEVSEMASSSGIEIAFRPIPSAGLLVPYRITIPTLVGTAELKSKRVAITTAANRHIALEH